MSFFWPIRVYYEDTDCGGVVYHASYIRFLERARTEWLRQLGCEQDDLRHQEGVLFAVYSINIDYLLPARFNDLLQVGVEPLWMKKASIEFEQEIFRQDVTKKITICRARVKIACLTAEQLSPCPIPKSILLEMKSAG